MLKSANGLTGIISGRYGDISLTFDKCKIYKMKNNAISKEII